MLLLDEPWLGLSPKLAAEVTLSLRNITATGCSVLLAEQGGYCVETNFRPLWALLSGLG
jgi:ABC-type branched-subunit amino acid transport system ATPase component